MPEPVAAAEPVAPGPAPGKGGRSALKVVTIYLEQGDDEFLEAITHTGWTAKSKIAVSRLGAGEIVAELSARVDQQGTGCKRR